MRTDRAMARFMADNARKVSQLETPDGRRFITDYLWHRGWKDDFFGDQLMDEYTPSATGGTLAWPGTHGGVVQFDTAAVNANFYRLYLGNAGDGFPSIRPDRGFMCMHIVSHFTSTTAGNHRSVMSIRNAARARWIDFGVQTWVDAANFAIQCGDAGGSSSSSTGVPLDTASHVFVMTSRDGTSIDCFVDGVWRVSHTTNIPVGAVYTPCLEVYAGGAVNRRQLTDFWGVWPLWAGEIG